LLIRSEDAAERSGLCTHVHSGVFGLSPRVRFTDHLRFDPWRHVLSQGASVHLLRAADAHCEFLTALFLEVHYASRDHRPGVILFRNEKQVPQYDAGIQPSIPPADCGSRIPNLELIRPTQINAVCSK
jgi:hypothetical protein